MGWTEQTCSQEQVELVPVSGSNVAGDQVVEDCFGSLVSGPLAMAGCRVTERLWLLEDLGGLDGTDLQLRLIECTCHFACLHSSDSTDDTCTD